MIHQSTSVSYKIFHQFSFSFQIFTGKPGLVSSSHATGPLRRVLLDAINNNNNNNDNRRLVKATEQITSEART